jgi:hypothetical protein
VLKLANKKSGILPKAPYFHLPLSDILLNLNLNKIVKKDFLFLVIGKKLDLTLTLTTKKQRPPAAKNIMSIFNPSSQRFQNF